MKALNIISKQDNERGMALVIVLMIAAILTALVTEFSYNVYINTSLLDNWRTLQRLSLAAESGASLSAELIRQNTEGKSYTYPGSVYLPPYDPFGDEYFVSLKLEDEDSKFNINYIVNQDGSLNQERYDGLLRLLEALKLDRTIADGIADYIDEDTLERQQRGGEDKARNAPMESIEELLLVAGMEAEAYNTLLPYVTVFGTGLININGAEKPVLMSLAPEVTEEMAGRVVDYRASTRFESTSMLQRVVGYETLGISLLGRVTVKGTAFRVTSEASVASGLKRRVECVLDAAGKVYFWKET